MKTDSFTEPPGGCALTLYWLTIIVVTLTISSHALAETSDILQLSQQISLSEKPTQSNSNTLLVSGCNDYPYHDNRNQIYFETIFFHRTLFCKTKMSTIQNSTTFRVLSPRPFPPY